MDANSSLARDGVAAQRKEEPQSARTRHCKMPTGNVVQWAAAATNVCAPNPALMRFVPYRHLQTLQKCYRDEQAAKDEALSEINALNQRYDRHFEFSCCPQLHGMANIPCPELTTVSGRRMAASRRSAATIWRCCTAWKHRRRLSSGGSTNNATATNTQSNYGR